MSSCHCSGVEAQFGERAAARELARYRRRGPGRTTRALLGLLQARGVEGATLLDIGGGIGAIQHELLRAGALRATHVDAASHYLEASAGEARRLGHADRVRYLYGDFLELADTVEDADIVTLDRVICCYPDMRRLVERSAARARRLYGVTFPRDRLALRGGIPLLNLWCRLRRTPFRVFLHDPGEVDATIQAQGLRPVAHCTLLLWHVRIYAR